MGWVLPKMSLKALQSKPNTPLHHQYLSVSFESDGIADPAEIAYRNKMVFEKFCQGSKWHLL